jgi:hypothetical protein
LPPIVGGWSTVKLKPYLQGAFHSDGGPVRQPVGGRLNPIYELDTVTEARPWYELNWVAITAVARRLSIGRAQTLRKWLRRRRQHRWSAIAWNQHAG